MLLGLVVLAGCNDSTTSGPVVIFAAASLQDVLEEVVAEIESDTGIPVVVNGASSSLLARQIQQGARADVFISANPDWMDVLVREGRVEVASRVDLLENTLVVVGLAERAEGIGAPCDVLTFGRIAVGDPAHVPAGQYAERALRILGCWDDVAPRLIPCADVRAALRLVSDGQVPLGIVYETDARASDDCVVLARFSSSESGPIRYPVALVSGASDHARAVWAALQQRTSRAIFEKHEFRFVGSR